MKAGSGTKRISLPTGWVPVTALVTGIICEVPREARVIYWHPPGTLTQK